jgi:cyclic pyranopterin phosphate synthase
MSLVDRFKRKITYLRLSVTDRCDLRCLYCMKEKMEFLPKAKILTFEEIERLCDIFIELGVNKIRLTGGEPLVRKNIINLINNLGSKLDNSNLKELTLTTNGTLLSTYANQLKKAGVERINVSLDTLNKKKYKKITRFGELDNVLEGINYAQKYNIKIKINTVAIKNFNEDEFELIVKWCSDNNLDLSFIEVMPMGETDFARHLQFVPLNEVYKKLNNKFNFYKIDKSTGGPSVYYNSRQLRNNIGFITPLTENFCANCNRIRITSTGKLFMCLGQNDYVDFRDILRKNYSNDSIKEKIFLALNLKPKKHDFIIEKNTKPYMTRLMNITGG